MVTKSDRERDTRNSNPIAPAIVAMALYNERYAAQRGGVMEFWDTLRKSEKDECKRIAERVRDVPMR